MCLWLTRLLRAGVSFEDPIKRSRVAVFACSCTLRVPVVMVVGSAPSCHDSERVQVRFSIVAVSPFPVVLAN
jgi:hypothetical protein